MKKSDPSTKAGDALSYSMIEAINDYGSIQISEKVVMSIVKKAALKVPGVTRLASGRFFDSLASAIRNNAASDNAVKLEILGNDVKVRLKVYIAYGKNIPEIALKIQNTVTDEVRFITGMNVLRVDVEIQEVETSCTSEH